MRFADLVGSARAAVMAGSGDEATYGLVRLRGGMTHHVFAPVDALDVVVKVFQTTNRDEPEREWDALLAHTGRGIAPEPLHFDYGDPATVIMTRVSGSSLAADGLSPDHAHQIGRVHRLVHRVVPEVRRPLAHGRAQRSASPDGR